MSSTADHLHRPGAGAPSAFEEATYRKVSWRLSPLLLLLADQVVGAVGVSGGLGKQDQAVAEAGVQAY